jgi:SAM-dependent methyltransferase
MSLTDVEANAFRSFERDAHDRVAEGYARSFAPITILAAQPLLDAVHMAHGCSLLDVACGPGVVAGTAAKRGARAVGVDLSSKMVEIASRLHPEVVFRVADVEHLPFDNNAFDAVVCAFGLGHFSRPETAVDECCRVLRPGGWAGVSWWADFGRQRLQGLFREAIAEVGLPPAPGVPQGHNAQRFADPARLEGLLVGAGLDDVTVKTVTSTLNVPDSEALWTIGMDSLGLTGSAIRHASADRQAATRAAFDRATGAYATGSGLAIPLAFHVACGRR